MGTCKVLNCPYKDWACGYCPKHYMQYYRNGKISKDKKHPKIALYDIDTDELIEVYETIEDAAYDNGVSVSGIKSAITKNQGIMKNKEMKFKLVEG